MNKTGVLLKRFFPYYRKHWKTVGLDLCCAGLTTVCELVLPAIVRQMTNVALYSRAELTFRFIGSMSAVYLILRVIDCVAHYYMADMGHVMGVRIETDMRGDAYRHLQKLSHTYYNNTKIGQIMGRITNDLFDVTEFSHHCPEEFFIAGIKTLVAFLVLARVSLPLTLLVFSLVPVMALSCIKTNRKMKQAFADQRVQIGELNACIEDSLLGHRVVKAFGNEEMECEKFQEGNKTFYEIKKTTYKYMARFQCTTRAFDGAMYLTVIFAGGCFVWKNLITPGDLVAYIMYVSTLIMTIRRIIEFAEQFQRGMTGIDRFFEIMDADVEITNLPDAIELQSVRGHIEFSGVSFEYPDDHNRVFRHLNLDIPPGEKVAIVGPSGGGKTTLCNLLPRFYDVTEGKILLDGEDIKKYTLQSLRKNIGIVQQDVYLFSGTVMENIMYGAPGATPEEARRAAEKAGAGKFIEGLPQGYDTYIGERGVKLSGGQRQRISIARLFLKNPPVMILDEATAALDNESEYEVAKSLEALSRGRTTITIAHRLSSIKNSDRILVLTEEGITEEGSHEALMKAKGIYYQFYTMADRMK